MADSKPMPVRTVHVELKDAYEGFWADVQTNCAYAIKQELNSGEPPRVFEAFAPLVRGWNLTDAQGTPLPCPTTPDALRIDIPDEVLGQLLTGYREALEAAAQLPKV
jgi:hypothetical protein